MTNSSSQNWKVEHSCPQCGAPVVLEETDRLFCCSFCRVRLFIWSGECFRYFLSPPAPVAEPLVFIPYWRFKGIVYSLDGAEVTSRIVDSNLLAMSSTPLPLSLGVRPQVLKLRYATPETSGAFLAPDLPFKALVSGDPSAPIPADHSGPADSVPFRYFIGETVSLIFTPVYARGNSFMDAILQRPLGLIPEALRERFSNEGPRAVQPGDSRSSPGRAASFRIGFLPTLCPRCGWDLDAERDSLVLFCRNCNSAWQARDGALNEVGFSFLPLGGEAAVCLPFWRLGVDISGLALRSYDDLLRTANLTGIAPKAPENSQLHFWIPAFKSQPNLFLRLARSLTILQKEPEAGVEPPKSPLFPVTLPLSEALESIRILIASMAVPKKLLIPRIHEMGLSHKAHTLVYLPFASRGEEFIQPQLQMSIQKNALRWGRLI